MCRFSHKLTSKQTALLFKDVMSPANVLFLWNFHCNRSWDYSKSEDDIQHGFFRGVFNLYLSENSFGYASVQGRCSVVVLFFARFWLMLEYSTAETIDRRVRLHSTSFRYFTVISDVNNKNFIKNCITDASSNLESLIVLSQLTIE